MKVLIATHNQGRFREMASFIKTWGLKPLSLADLSIKDDVEETGSTFEENALQKARFFRKLSGIPTVADDSGIVIDVLENELGIHTRRWGAGPAASDAEWIEHFLQRMKNEENKRAHFICTLAYIDESGAEHMFEGRCSGTITEELEADYLPGLPISACFKPDGCNAVFSALTIEQKNSTSHRGKAAHHLREHLEQK